MLISNDAKKIQVNNKIDNRTISIFLQKSIHLDKPSPNLATYS